MGQQDRPDRRRQPDVVLDAEKELAIRLGQALESVMMSPPWRTLTELLSAHSKDVGRFGLRDKDNTREYWAGYQDGIDYVLDTIPRFVQQAKTILAEAEAEEEAGTELLGHFIGRASGEVSGSE